MNGSRLQPTKPFCINEECAIEARVLWSSGAFVTERKILLSRNPSTMVVSVERSNLPGTHFGQLFSRKTSPKKSLPINLSTATTMLPLEKGEKGSNDSPNHQSKRRASRKKKSKITAIRTTCAIIFSEPSPQKILQQVSRFCPIYIFRTGRWTLAPSPNRDARNWDLSSFWERLTWLGSGMSFKNLLRNFWHLKMKRFFFCKMPSKINQLDIQWTWSATLVHGIEVAMKTYFQYRSTIQYQDS